MNINKFEKKISHMRKEHREIGEKILIKPEMVVYLSATEIAKRFDTSIGSIVRFSKNLGFSGYTEMRDVFKEMLGVGKGPLKILKESRESILGDEVSILKETINKSMDSRIESAASMISTSDAVIVAGYGYAGIIGELLASYIEVTGLEVKSVKDSYFDMMANIISLSNKKTVFIVISYFKYFKDIVKAEEKAKENNLKVIAVTDSLFSPVAMRADSVIPVEVKRQGIVYTHSPVVAVFDEIGLKLARNREKETKSILKITEKIWEEDIFFE